MLAEPAAFEAVDCGHAIETWADCAQALLFPALKEHIAWSDGKYSTSEQHTAVVIAQGAHESQAQRCKQELPMMSGDIRRTTTSSTVHIATFITGSGSMFTFLNSGMMRHLSTRVRNFLSTTDVWGLGGTVHVLGNTSKKASKGWESLCHAYAEYTASLPPKHLVLTVDSGDGLMQASAIEVAAAFEHVAGGRPLAFSLETGCPKGFCIPIKSVVGNNANHTPSGISGLQNVNGGFVMGQAWAVHKLWHAVATNTDNIACCHKGKLHPQLGIGRFALQYPELVSFDAKQHLAATIGTKAANEWLEHYEICEHASPKISTSVVLRHRVRNRHTGVSPVYLHIPGLYVPQKHKSMRIYEEIVNAIVPKPADN